MSGGYQLTSLLLHEGKTGKRATVERQLQEVYDKGQMTDCFSAFGTKLAWENT